MILYIRSEDAEDLVIDSVGLEIDSVDFDLVFDTVDLVMDSVELEIDSVDFDLKLPFWGWLPCRVAWIDTVDFDFKLPFWGWLPCCVA